MPNRESGKPKAPHCAAIFLHPTKAIDRFLRSRNELSQRSAVELLLRG